MFWKKKKIVRDAKTVEKCTVCKTERIRDYTAGDVIFGTSDFCKLCKKPARIERIYAQIRE